MLLQKKYLQQLSRVLPITSIQEVKSESIVIVMPEYLTLVVQFLKQHIASQYKVLSCISGVDFLGKNLRFAVVYDLLSLVFNSRIRIKTFLGELASVPSLVDIFPNANWWEREVWDLFGIFFENHPDLRRILTDYGFEGWPMRKDFPLYGFTEVRYDENHKRIVAEPVELTQEFRRFDFESAW
jgi:NADH dehydrogenase (ubiquinone) Fe-S protein 3